MNQYRLFLLLLLTLSLASCKTEDKGISGLDNYILSFALSDDAGHAYTGLIGENTVRLTIPSTVATTQLKPIFKISQLATIAPDPKEIKDWGKEQTFTVTSKAGEGRKYKVIINFVPNELASSIVLSTQEDVNSFVASDGMIINGDLIIGAENGTDTITDISSLSKIREVKYNMIINSTFKGDLAQMSDLQRIGSLILHNAQHFTVLNMPNLEIICEDIQVSKDDRQVKNAKCFLSSVSMPKLKSVGDMIFNRSESLATINFPSLQKAGDIYVRYAPLASIDFGQLQTAQSITLHNQGNSGSIQEVSFPKLTKVGDVLIDGFQQIESIQMDELVECNTFQIANHREIPLVLLPKLAKVTSKFTVDSYQNKIGKLDLSSLVNTPGDLMFGLVQKIEFPKLKSAGFLKIRNYYPTLFTQEIAVDKLEIEVKEENITEVNLDLFKIKHDLMITLRSEVVKVTLPNEINGEFILSINGEVMPKLIGLTKVNKRFNISGSVLNIILPETLTEVSGELELASCWSGKCVQAEKLRRVGNITYPSRLESLEMPALEQIDNNLNLDRMSNLHTIAMPKLTKVVGKVIIAGAPWSPNKVLTNLDGLSSLVEATSVQINNCDALVDYSGLKKLITSGNLKEKNWAVKDNAYNPTFQDLIDGKYTQP